MMLQPLVLATALFATFAGPQSDPRAQAPRSESPAAQPRQASAAPWDARAVEHLLNRAALDRKSVV